LQVTLAGTDTTRGDAFTYPATADVSYGEASGDAV